LWLALRQVPSSELRQRLSQADYFWLIPALVVQFLAILARAERWRVLLGPQVSLKDTFWAQGIGFLFTNVLPFRLGEPARVIALSGRSRLPIAQVAATAVLERLLDVTTIVLVLAGVLPFMQVPAQVQQAGLLVGVAAIVGLLLIFGLVRLQQRSEILVQAWSVRLFPRYAKALTTQWHELLSGFSGLTQGRVAGAVLFWSLITWAYSIGMYYAVLYAFQPKVTLVEAAFLIAALALAITIPSGPGFIGVFQWVGQQALVLPFGTKYDAANALAIIMTVYLIYYLFTTALGIVGLWQFGQSFVKLGQALSNKPPAGSKYTPVPTSQPVEGSE
jgi:hypothetical protein